MVFPLLSAFFPPLMLTDYKLVDRFPSELTFFPNIYGIICISEQAATRSGNEESVKVVWRRLKYVKIPKHTKAEEGD